MVNVDVVTLSRTDHPVCAFIRRLRSIFLMAQPPLLSEEGNTLSWQCIHTGNVSEAVSLLDPVGGYFHLSL